MQCEIRAMSDGREGRSRVSDTLPKRGRVNEVCKEWLVHEDGALAYQLQQKEVQEHYTGNRSRNAIVREDFPKAKDEQRREEEEALAKYHEMIQIQEERDARLAKDMAQRLQIEEEEEYRRRIQEDESVASQIQEREMQRTKEAKIRPLLSSHQGAIPVGDVNSVGLPLPQASHCHSTSHNHHQHYQQQQQKQQQYNLNQQFRTLIVDEPEEMPDLSDLDLQEEHLRQMQEQKDEELARLLQEQEEELDSLEMMDKDRLLAIEAQDKELAKLLQDRERAKAKRARERAKQRALLKKQQQQQQNLQQQQQQLQQPLQSDDGELAENAIGESPIARPTSLDINKVNKPRLPDPEEITVVSNVTPLPNIAMAIDPTYTPPRGSASSSTIPSPTYCLPPPEFEEEDDSPVPPYMPIQGQRRTASLEKKQKKSKVKDGCKQQ